MTESGKLGISIAVPNKGRLSEQTVDLLERAGLAIETGGSRQLFAQTWGGRVRVLFVRAQDIPEFVQDGLADLGITGLDLVLETRAKVQRRVDLRFGACRLVVAVPEKRRVRSLKELPKNLTVATSFPALTRTYFQKKGRRVKIVPVSGATEVMPHIGVADCITDLTASGSTLAMNDLVEVASILASTAQLIANGKARRDPAKRELMEDVEFALQSVVNARGKRYLMMDAPTAKLDEIRKIVPGIAGPTVMDLHGSPTMKAVHVVVNESEIYAVTRKLQRLGCKGILIVPVDRMVN